MASVRRLDIPWVGLVSGPGAWMVSLQANYVLVPWQCSHQIFPVPWIALALAAVALLGGLISLRSYRFAGSETHRFISGIGLMAACLFAAIILLQAFAGFIFDGCER